MDSNGSSSVVNTSYNDAGGNSKNETNPEVSSKFREQLLTQNFMNLTISAANKVAAPKKLILAERNENVDVVEQTISSKGLKFSDDDLEKDFVGKSSLPTYDPVKYLSPRPKFLRYNPNRRRRMFVLQGNEEGVNSSGGGKGMPSSELELDLGSAGFEDSCSQKESVEVAEEKIDEEGEGEDEGKGEEEEIVEFGHDRWWSIKEFLKFLFVMMAVVLTTRAICSMNSPTPSHTLESIRSFKDSYNNVYGVAYSNFSGLVHNSIRESNLLVGRLKEEVIYNGYEGASMVETIVEFVEMQNQNAQINDVLSKEVENDDTDVVLDEIGGNQDNTGKLQSIELLQERDEVIEIDDIESEIEDYDQPLKEDSEADEKHSQSITDADYEITKDVENVEENEIRVTLANFDVVVAALIGFLVLILTSFGVMHHSKQTKSSSPVTTMVAKENNDDEEGENMDLEPSPNTSSLIQQIHEEMTLNSASLQTDISEEISHFYAPSVELLGEFDYGEVTNSLKSAEAELSNSLIQVTTVLSSRMKPSHKKASAGDSHTVKKQMCKNTETSSNITPSPVRRSSRLQNRRSAMRP